ncbi:hypothetical protein [Luteibacter sp. E-22]|uniref:hypothetical protein n=1 Tax=Luteibacter sp. E-22 TaxID=3404050 RepID=UPI003CE9BE87
MKRFNLYDMFELGKALAPLQSMDGSAEVGAYAYSIYVARNTLQGFLGPDGPFLNSGRRCVAKVLSALEAVLPQNDFFSLFGSKEVINDSRAWNVKNGLTELETVMRNEMPDVAAYIVSQKGIYRTDDLIGSAEKQVAESILPMLPPQTIDDLRAAGKCLAYELGTGCAFHLWRAVESVIAFYFFELTGKTFGDVGTQRNWGAYIRALENASADVKVTAMLRHIKDEFRNPQTHPEEQVDVQSAQRLFAVAVSAIEQMCMSGYAFLRGCAQDKGLPPPAPTYQFLAGSPRQNIYALPEP